MHANQVMSSRQCDFITIKITVSAKHHLARKQWSIIVPLTLSATQLHVSKKKYLWLAVNNLHPNYWANVGNFYFWVLLFDSNQTLYNKACFVFKHHLVTKIKYVQSRKQIYASVQMVAACWLFCIQKNVILTVGLLILTTRWHKSQHSCGWAFWGVLRSLRLVMCEQLLRR